MILVDTSIWIKFIRNQEPYAQELDRLLSLDDVAGHEMVYGEMLIGDHGGRQEFLAAYSLMYRAASVPHREVVEFVRSRKLFVRGVGWVDFHLLASALVERFFLWTADTKLDAVAAEVGVKYRFSSSTGTAL